MYSMLSGKPNEYCIHQIFLLQVAILALQEDTHKSLAELSFLIYQRVA